MPRAPQATRILVSLFHTPTDAGREVFYCVLRAWELVAGLEYQQVHPNYPGHKLLLCLKGHGFIRVNGRVWPVGPGHVAWIFNHHENAHWPAEGSPWEMYWIRVEGPKMDQIYKTLTASGSPVFTRIEAARAATFFRRIFRIMKRRSIAMEAALHAEVASLITLLFEARHSATPATTGQTEIPASLHKPLEAMRLYFQKPLRVSDLAKLAGMSVTNFFRHFKAATGTSPIDWLRRERINQAKGRLSGPADSWAAVPGKPGYSDQFISGRFSNGRPGFSP